MKKGLLLKVKFLACSLPLVHILSQKSSKTVCSGSTLILYSPLCLTFLSGLLCSGFLVNTMDCIVLVNWDLDGILRTVCSVVWYSPGEVMWYSDYCIKTFITYITVTFPTPKCSSSWCVSDWHFSPTSIAMKQVPTTYPTPLFSFFISSLPHTEILNLTEYSTCPIYLIFPHSTTLTFSCLTTYIYIYICRTAPLTSRCCILYIYSTNTRTEYFKHAAHSPFFPLQNVVYFIMLPFLVPVLFTF